MRARFRTKVFVASVTAAGISLLLAAGLLSWQVRQQQRATIGERLVQEARVIAELLSRASVDAADLDVEADRLAEFSASRVTLIAEDGRVVGDSTADAAGLATLENHAARPEVVEARERGIGT